MVNKDTVNYQPSPLQLISRIHSLIFLWTSKGFISSVFIVLRLLANTLVSQKIECSFLLMPQGKLSPRRIFIINP